MHGAAVNLDGFQYLAGWRPATASLFLPVLSASRVGDRAAVRVGISGRPIRATVFGKVALVRRVGRPALPPGVELQLEPMSVPAARFLALAARGETVTFLERAPRYAADRVLAVEHGGRRFEAATLNLSEGGCALRWPDGLPLPGDAVNLRIASGLFRPALRAIVCWSRPGGAEEHAVGLRIVVEGLAGRAWRALVAEVARSGARAV
ncbi:PilZ domain-containing protein [Anaeromyxobacter oryzisoli]|uniref:PilZ domain-containing protein n=1 Tax=Anaeromyxobacter oryzisoli TaxID=2925408 RepID=UPI001F56108E|nr:PilZ domain-containing protein [Anaeromyxobacter sp. SG63]